MSSDPARECSATCSDLCEGFAVELALVFEPAGSCASSGIVDSRPDWFGTSSMAGSSGVSCGLPSRERRGGALSRSIHALKRS